MRDRRTEPVIAYIGIGSNLHDPERQVRSALDVLGDLPGCHLTLRSSLYRSAPFGPVEQSDFCNAVAAIETAVPPDLLLSCLKEIERSRGRAAGGERWGPRVLDLDLLVYGDEVLDTEELTIPHPGIRERNFVLLPLREIAPGLVIPGLGPVADLAIDEQEPPIARID